MLRYLQPRNKLHKTGDGPPTKRRNHPTFQTFYLTWHSECCGAVVRHIYYVLLLISSGQSPVRQTASCIVSGVVPRLSTDIDTILICIETTSISIEVVALNTRTPRNLPALFCLMTVQYAN
ncbi:hypothetical protein EVAR_18890_1 [Eumeta japonica]|uniref:Uncharacterized protein n=1 Tax=Eumeta variegata TaxID=151549 RepID=A0A4C1V1Q6_EUMVA|nr:hypothetical protein EVAR_18890_1 [Eumeta japonica]